LPRAESGYLLTRPGSNGADGLAIATPRLFEDSGAEGTYRRIKLEVLRIAKRSDLPDFSFFVLRRSCASENAVVRTADSVGRGPFAFC
jgi:hypothetical protein